MNFNAYDNSRKSKVKVPVSGSFYAHAFSEFPVNLPENVGIFSSKQAFTDRFQNGYLSCVFSSGGGGGGGTEARPGTERRCSHNLQSGPVKTWTAVFVIINISDRRSTYLK